MKISLKIASLFVLLILAGCSKEKPAETPPAPAAEPAVLKPATDTLHKAEGMNEVVADEAAAQRKKIEESSQ